jgi:hypothetical protein
MKTDLTDILMPPSLALAFLAFAGVYGRAIRGRRPFTPFMRGFTIYGTLYVLGMGYIVLGVARLGLPDWMYVGLPVTWSLALGLVAWRRRSSRRGGRMPD